MGETVLYFSIHSIEQIKKDFPKLENPFSVYKENQCGITWGWGGKDMLSCCGKIIRINKKLSNGCYTLLNPPKEEDYEPIYRNVKYSWDPKLGDVLEVELDPQINGYYFLNNVDGEISISERYKPNQSFGVIKNMPTNAFNKKHRLISRL